MKKVAIIGAGISGLFIANLFKRSSRYQVSIYEKNKRISLEEGYGIQLSVNSVKLLNEIGFDKLNNDQKFNPIKIDFYSNKGLNKICELNLSHFNYNNHKYTTLKRSVLVDFLLNDLKGLIKTDYSVSRIDQQNQKIKLTFRNHKIIECDYLIISDGVFSKSKNLISNNQIQPKYNNTLAIRGILSDCNNLINKHNISLFLGPDFHYVIYPVNSNMKLNFIAIIKYKLSIEEQKNYFLFNDDTFIEKIIDKVPKENKDLIRSLKNLRIFPVFVSDNFYKIKNENIHLIGDAFFAYPPSFAQGASQSIEGAYELFRSIESNTENNFFKNRMNKTKMVNNRSKINEFAFHFSNPLATFFRNMFLKKLVKNRKFLESYLGKIYKN